MFLLGWVVVVVVVVAAVAAVAADFRLSSPGVGRESHASVRFLIVLVAVVFKGSTRCWGRLEGLRHGSNCKKRNLGQLLNKYLGEGVSFVP